jgi:hypothetical protein
MALHCRCHRCAICDAPGRADAEPETIAGNVLPESAIGGLFAHYADGRLERLVSREIFAFRSGRNVGVSGFYIAPRFTGVRPDRIMNVLEQLGFRGRRSNDVLITAGNRASIFQTRSGELLATGCELTMRIGCGGSVNVGTGVITPGIFDAIEPCVAPTVPAKTVRQRQRGKCIVM